MAAHVEYALISRILDYQDFFTVQKARITEEFFLEALCRQVFCFIRDHFTSRYTYGSVPSWDIVLQRFPAFQRAYSNDTVATLCEQLHHAKLSVQIKSLAEQLWEVADQNPREALSLVRASSSQLSGMHERSNDLLMSDSYEILKQEYDLVADGHGLLGIPWPWGVLNDETQGLQPGQFIVLYGRPKNMKTWVGLAIASHAYLHAHQRVLVISMEMSSTDIQRRAASVCAKVDYQKWRKAQLQPYDRDRLFNWLQFLKQGERTVTNSNGNHPEFLAMSGMGEGIGLVQAKIFEFRPTLVVVDGLYRLRNDRNKTRSIDWKDVTAVVQDLNETAKTLNIPIIGITQANRSAAKASPKEADVAELAFADALGQECDMAIRVKKEKDPQTHEPEVIMSFPAAREYEVENIVIHGIPGVNFGFKRIWIPQADPNNGNGNGGQQGGGKQGNGSGYGGGKKSGGGGGQQALPNGGRMAPKLPFARY